jgi:t-SNARE complex subunit (syntaxin)
MAKEKGLNERVIEALDIVNEASEALDGARIQGDEMRAAFKKIAKPLARLRKLFEDMAEAVDDLDDALGSIDSELENEKDLKLEPHVDALEVAAETLEQVMTLDLESE